MTNKSVWQLVAEQELRHRDQSTNVAFWEDVIKREQEKAKQPQKTAQSNLWDTVNTQAKQYGRVDTPELNWGPDVGTEKIK